MLQITYQIFDYVSSFWLKNLIHFMVRKKIKIVLDNTLQFNIQRRNDKCIMNELTRGSLSVKQLTHLNACRLYLNKIHLIDIIYPDGKNLIIIT